MEILGLKNTVNEKKSMGGLNSKMKGQKKELEDRVIENNANKRK